MDRGGGRGGGRGCTGAVLHYLVQGSHVLQVPTCTPYDIACMLALSVGNLQPRRLEMCYTAVS